jgi:hypothetical protein
VKAAVRQLRGDDEREVDLEEPLLPAPRTNDRDEPAGHVVGAVSVLRPGLRVPGVLVQPDLVGEDGDVVEPRRA